MITPHLMCANFFMINLNVIISFMLQIFKTLAKQVAGKLPPRKLTPRKLPPMKIPPYESSPL